MAEMAGPGPGVEELVEAGSEQTEKRGSSRSILLILLLLLLLCTVVTAVDVWVERTPEQREFITRNLECLQCHTELIPDMARSSVHDPFLKESCRTCHTPHGKEVVERVTGGGWRRWEQVKVVLEWLPLRLACEAFESPAAVTEESTSTVVLSETVAREKGEDSELTAQRSELCWICHGDLAQAKVGLPHQHAPFEGGYCTDCHDPHASDYRVLLKRDERDLCPSCHPMFDELAKDQLHPPYEGRYCTNCHDPHASEWRGVLVDNQRDLCFVCHPSVAPLSLKAVQHNPFLYDNCTGCHEPHASDNLPLLIDQQPTLCYGCHPQIQSDFVQPSHHPVGTVQLNCADCHNPHAADYNYLLSAKNNNMCYQCHEVPIQASFDDSAHKERLCIDCHTPHGSDYAPMLRERNPDICLNCHGTTVDGENKHPFRPTYYDPKAQDALTCTSTCHNPHGTTFNYMLVDWYYPMDGLCLQCHKRVGIDF
ncbi:MAG: hypothetical protein Kow0056_06660 [Coriobacteriia bacterium]